MERALAPPVSPNWRANVFGFLSLPILSAVDPRKVSGNYGIEDIRLALKWLQSNAQSFGCDPARVTLYGAGSGGTNIYALLTNPDNQGLFHAAIALSASPNITMDLATAQQRNLGYLARLQNTSCGNTRDPLACLYALPAEELLAAIPDSWHDSTNRHLSSPAGSQDTPGLVIVDGVTVRMDFLHGLRAALVDVPLLLQSERAELAMDGQPVDQAGQALQNMTWQAYQNYLTNEFFAVGKWGGEVGPALTKLYQPEVAVKNHTTLQAYFDMTTDIGLFCPQVTLAFAAARAGHRKSPIFVSVLQQPPSHGLHIRWNVSRIWRAGVPFAPIHPLRQTFHLWDHVLGHSDWGYMSAPSGSAQSRTFRPRARDLQLARLVRSGWLDFALSGGRRCGDMQPFGRVHWVARHGYNVALLGKANASQEGVTVTNRRNYRRGYCLGIEQALFANPASVDARFWWTN
eukprot:g419.t1